MFSPLAVFGNNGLLLITIVIVCDSTVICCYFRFWFLFCENRLSLVECWSATRLDRIDLKLNLLYMIQFSEQMQITTASCWQFRALCFPSRKEDACFQMRLNYGPAAHFLMFFISWTDCRLAGTLGLLHILIYKVIFIIFMAFLA